MELADLESQFLDHARKVRLAKISDQLMDFHRNARHCIENEMNKPASQVLTLNVIFTVCLGPNFLLLLRFYQKILNEVSELVLEEMKSNLPENFCSGILFECIKFFENVEFYMKKQYDLKNALQIDREDNMSFLPSDKIDPLVSLVLDHYSKYQQLRDLLIEEKKVLQKYMKDQEIEYFKMFP